MTTQTRHQASFSRTRFRLRGLTLIEVIVVAFVFSLLTLTLTQIMVGGLRAWRKGQTDLKLRADARNAIDQIQSDLHQVVPAGMSIPALASASKSNELQFTRSNFTTGVLGAPFTVDYYIDNTTYQLTREDNESGAARYVVVAESVVGTDPRTGGIASFFVWSPSPTTMRIVLYMVQDAALNLSSTNFQLDSITESSSAYLMTSNPLGAGPNPPSSFNVPTDLRDPRPMAGVRLTGRPLEPGAGPGVADDTQVEIRAAAFYNACISPGSRSGER